MTDSEHKQSESKNVLGPVEDRIFLYVLLLKIYLLMTDLSYEYTARLHILCKFLVDHKKDSSWRS